MENITITDYATCVEASLETAKYIANVLLSQASEQTLFLVSGGSSAKAASAVASELDLNTTSSVVLAQVDEVYGPAMHDKSNWKELLKLGLKPDMFADSTEMLTLGTSAEDVAIEYNRILQNRIDNSSYKIALLGLGAEGQIAGIHPMDQQQFNELFLQENGVVSYVADDYERITMTGISLLQMDEVVVYGCGKSKKDAIRKLSEQQMINKYPLQILKKLQKVSIFVSEE